MGYVIMLSNALSKSHQFPDEGTEEPIFHHHK